MPKVHFITQGCSANHADSEIMAGLLHRDGHVLVKNSDEADLVVFNTCTVKGPTESFFKKKLHELQHAGKTVIVAGCIPQSERNLDQFQHISVIGTYQLGKITEVADQTLAGNTVHVLSRTNENRLNLPKIRKNAFIEIVPISQGCLGSCTFCKTKQARGGLYSYPAHDIVRHISTAVREGAKEIWLTSQDDGAYGLDIGTTLAELLRQVVAIPRDFKVRVGMANPDFIKEMYVDLIPLLKHEKVYKFLHIPLQSGSDDVLKAMRRQYTVADYKNIVHACKQAIPEITISTDIICGFPTETQEQFLQTLKLIEQTKPDMINISKFWPRPGTHAASLPQLPGEIIKQRSREVSLLFQRIAQENNEQWIGWEGPVLVTEQGRFGTLIGKNHSYKQVVLTEQVPLGSMVHVRITHAKPFDLRGEVVQVTS